MKLSILAFPLSVVLLTGTASAEPSEGEELYQENCVACHQRMAGGDGSALYTRDDRRVKSLEGLHSQVNRCKDNLQLRLFDDEVAAIAGYLNERYYRFEE
ncbi:c-type cytochrome [Thiohalomonas denitrificans]|uniref:Cytochrome C oxidase, cbb3-type, subunit III n=1 Tax=Thiohalomonas denitrificans TaxID=415747 RepID=A0A1G5Q3T6_9GAMM|nr:cytochrome c [Thiohalomonas denitrificans]SCZ56332.1 Cytochrome C oxidase, cbb3-type, subunit III [Thiohalomonas denitrificans]